MNTSRRDFDSSRPGWKWALSVICLGLCGFLPGLPASTLVAAPPPVWPVLEQVEGTNVTILFPGATASVQGTNGMPLVDGAEVTAGTGSRATVRLSELTVTRLRAGSQLQIHARNPALFAVADIHDFRSLLAKLNRRADGVSRHLFERLATEAPGLLASPEPSLREFVSALNRIIQTPARSLYEAAKTNGVSPFANMLSGRARELHGQTLGGADLVLFNRVLLENAYPLELTKAPKKSWLLQLKQGVLYFLNRDTETATDFETPNASGGTRGTEYELVAKDSLTLWRLFVGDGTMVLTNDPARLTPGQPDFQRIGKGTNVTTEVAPGVGGEMRLRVQATRSEDLVQWWLYYPAVLCLDDLPFTLEEADGLTNALVQWREGAFRNLLANLPPELPGESPAVRTFRASTALLVGEVEEARRLLAGVTLPAAGGVRDLIAAVLRQKPETNTPAGATAWLGRSYLLQSVRKLDEALAAARRAVAEQPAFGFGWERLAELEFSHGHHQAAARALTYAFKFSPDHAPAAALQGFVSAAQLRPRDAGEVFALAELLDPSLPDVWFGKGLLEFRQGQPEAGLRWLQDAVALDPERALLRSYLGKALGVNDKPVEAQKEYRRAMELDDGDPTAWLYSALDRYALNDVNTAIRDLEESQKRNENRAIYRSQLLLDQDRAVRSGSLARLYTRAGMEEVALREAARAVASDYANPSAHLFLADAYGALRDPTRVNLRHETAWFNEVLLANALSPVDAGVLSPTLSHLEYTRLFSRDGFAFNSLSEVRSDGQFHQAATHSGVFRRTAFSLDLDYQQNDGVRANNDLQRLEATAQLKHQLTDADTVLFMLSSMRGKAGDNFQHLDPAAASSSFRFEERQNPQAFALWRHDGGPESQSLFAAGRLESQVETAGRFNLPLIVVGNSGAPLATGPLTQTLDYAARLEIWHGEAQHILKTGKNTLVAGMRIQSGRFSTGDQLTGNPAQAAIFGDVTGAGIYHSADVEADFGRASFYAYDTYELAEDLHATAGLVGDLLEYPANFRHPPVAGGTEEKSRVLPKAGLVWSPAPRLTLRGMYARSLGGVSFDESYRLEPVQLAGFSQAFRTVIPESVAGSLSAHDLDLAGLALDLKLPWRSYFGITATSTESALDRQVGVFTLEPAPAFGSASQAPQSLRYRERAVGASLHKLAGDYWALGAVYGFSWNQLDVSPGYLQAESERAGLHHLRLQGVLNAPKGLFARASSLWLWQAAWGATTTREGHHELDLEAGWRFPRQRGELSVGILNLLDRDYRLAPLSAWPELPRERVFVARLRVNFH